MGGERDDAEGQGGQQGSGGIHYVKQVTLHAMQVMHRVTQMTQHRQSHDEMKPHQWKHHLLRQSGRSVRDGGA